MSKEYSEKRTDIEGNTWKVKLKSGNYRVYKNGQEVYKSGGKKKMDFEDAKWYMNTQIQKINERVNQRKQQSEEENKEAPAEDPTPFDNQAEITEEFRDNEAFKYALNEYIKAEARNSGMTREQIIDKVISDPESLPDNIKTEFPKYADLATSYDTQNYLYNWSDTNASLERIEDILTDAQKDRSDIVDDLRDETLGDRFRQDQTELELLLKENTYRNIFDSLDDASKRNVTPEMLRRMRDEQMSLDLTDKSAEQAQAANKIKTDINMDPTSLWDTVLDTYQKPLSYESDKPFNQREHQLALGSHGFGSTSLLDNQKEKFRARDNADYNNMFKMYDMFNNYGIGSRNDWIKMNQEEMNSNLAPWKTSADIINRDITRDNESKFNQDIFKKDIAEGEMATANQSLNERLAMEDMKNQVNQSEIQQAQQAYQNIYQLSLNALNFQNLSEDQKREVQAFEQNLWAQRAQVLDMLERTGIAKEELKLAKKAKSSSEFLQKVGTIAKIAVAGGALVAAPFTSGATIPVAIAALGMPEAARIGQSDGVFKFGTSASTGKG